MEIIVMLIGFIFLIPIMVLYSSFAWGYVATIIYSWFILPLFPNLPLFTWLQFAGIMMFVNCFIKLSANNIKKEYKDEQANWTNVLLNPWLALLAAWILHLFY